MHTEKIWLKLMIIKNIIMLNVKYIFTDEAISTFMKHNKIAWPWFHHRKVNNTQVPSSAKKSIF